MIYFLTVLMPILENRITKTTITATETMPPVVEVYSVYPLYLTSLLEGKRSTALKALLNTEKKEGMRFRFKNLNIDLKHQENNS